MTRLTITRPTRTPTVHDAVVDLEQAAMHVQKVAAEQRWAEYPGAMAALRTARAMVLRAAGNQEGK